MSAVTFKHKITKNPFLLFSPFLILFIIVAIIFPTNGRSGDEVKYLELAQNLVHGFFSPPPPDINLGNGPGYPIFLMPFIALHLPLITITLMNAILYYLSTVLLFKLLLQVTTFNKSLIFSIFWAFYINLYKWIPLVYTEIFVPFLVVLFIFCLQNAFTIEDAKKRKRYIFLSGFILGFMALAKPVFGYVLLCMLAGSALLWITKRRSSNYQKGVIILTIAFVTTLPYLAYTYHLTGRMLYWGSSGGTNLYWMSAPYEEEYGSWMTYPSDSVDKKRYFAGSIDSIFLRHHSDFEEINKYTGAEQDDVFKKIAVKNIKSHPVKFIKNCFSNIGRIFFNYPYSYTPQKPTTLLWLPQNGLLILLALFSLIPTIINWQKIPYPIRFMLFFVLLYLGASVLGSAENRMFNIAVPVLLIWIAFILQKTIKVSPKFK